MKLLADFQAVRDNDRLTASLEYALDIATKSPLIGDRVVLDDDEGHTALGLVVGVRGSSIDLRVDWTTWRDASVMQDWVSYLDFKTDFRFDKRLETSSTYQAARPLQVFSGV